MIKFSIIVPVYNVEEYLRRCLESICNQTYRNIEVILVDDGSTDCSPAICDEYALKDERILVIHKKNGGLSDARNTGMEVATGDYIFFIDSDDYIELDTCELFKSYAEKSYDILIGDAFVEGGICSLQHVQINKVIDGVSYYKRALKECKAPMAACINVYRRCFLLQENLWFKYGILHEDEEFTPRCFLNAQSVVITNIYFYHYAIRNDSITTKADKRKNAVDLFSTCVELSGIADTLADEELKKYIKDALVGKYLSLFQDGKLHQYGTEYLHKDFVWKNAYRLKNRLKALLFCIAPSLYYFVNLQVKKWGK